MKRKTTSMVMLALLVMAYGGCAGRSNTATDNFGVEVNHPKFKGPGELARHFGQVTEIINKSALDGEPVDMSWIDPAFREQLCLTLTIHNHCTL